MRGRTRGESAGYVLALSFAAAAPALGRWGSVPLAVLAAGAAGSRRLRRDGATRGARRLTVFALAAAALAGLVWIGGMPAFLVTSPVALVVAGHVASRLRWQDGPASGLVYLVAGGSMALLAGVAVAPSMLDGVVVAVATGSVAAAAVRTVVADERPTVLLAVTATAMAVGVGIGGAAPVAVATALLVTGSLAGFAYTAGAMTASGAYAGVVLSFVTIVAAGYRWFLLLGLFVVLGAAWTRYREEEKLRLGVVEEGEDRRGFTNVMANGAVALAGAVAVGVGDGGASWPALVFAGSVATATGDTLSSEIGSVHGDPRLITTMEIVAPGTDGGVSPVGELVTVVGAVAIGVAAAGLGVVGGGGVAAVAVGGIVGAHVDSFLGATVEGRFLENDGVNLVACLSGAVTAVAVGPLPFL